MALLGAAVGSITELSLAEYGKVIIFIQVLKSLNTCSKSKTENINLEPSLTHTSQCLSLLSLPTLLRAAQPLILSLLNPNKWITYDLNTMLGHFIYYTIIALYKSMRVIIAIFILLKKLWLTVVAKLADSLPIFPSAFSSFRLNWEAAFQPTINFPAPFASRHNHVTSFHPCMARLELLKSKQTFLPTSVPFYNRIQQTLRIQQNHKIQGIKTKDY